MRDMTPITFALFARRITLTKMILPTYDVIRLHDRQRRGGAPTPTLLRPSRRVILRQVQVKRLALRKIFAAQRTAQNRGLAVHALQVTRQQTQAFKQLAAVGKIATNQARRRCVRRRFW